MKPIVLVAILTLLLFPSRSGAQAYNYTDVTVLDAKNMIDSNPHLLVLDVRNQSEYVTGHIRNAKLIPLFELEDPANLTLVLQELNKTDEILVYCRAGVRSTMASEILVNNGFMHIYNMLGGILNWTSAGYPTYVNYPSIQEAVNNATEGTRLFVASGVYYEQLTLNKSLAIVGENRETTVIDANGTGSVVQMETDNASISGFTIRNSGCYCQGYSGVRVSHHQNINITDDKITQDGWAVGLDSTRDVVVASNEIANNSYGLYLGNSSGNIISGNYIGASVQYGIWLGNSSDNSILHNNFVGNKYQVFATIYSYGNVWNDTVEGNFWSNYTGVDEDHDGIGDAPYFIESYANSTDYHPLMGMFSSFDTALGTSVDVVSNSTVDDFEYLDANGTIKMHVSNSSATQTYGFCRIRIPNELMNVTSLQVIIDDGQTATLLPNYTVYANMNQTWIYFAYTHSTHEIVIIPELQPVTAILLLMIASLCAFIPYKGKRIKLHAHHTLSPRTTTHVPPCARAHAKGS
jgi:parallel beta-helix repeat protein